MKGYYYQGLKRIMKLVCGAGKDLQVIVLEHLQVRIRLRLFKVCS